MKKQIEEYPFMLTAKDLAEILTISKARAYEIMDLVSFPLIKLGRSKRVLKSEFFMWLQEQQKK